MTAQELYDEMKAALKFFELNFNQMDQVLVTVMPNGIVLRHGGATVGLSVPKEPT